jgi:adenine-specific DNA-methyltransferase
MSIEIKLKISNAIEAFNSNKLFSNAIDLFKALGYKTERQSRLSKSTFKGFVEAFPSALNVMNSKKSIAEQWNKVELLFQLTQAEMSRQSFLFDTGRFDDAIIESYLFVTIELNERVYITAMGTHRSCHGDPPLRERSN